MTLVEKAQKVMLFKANIAKECKKRGMKMPSDEKISAYINSGRPMTLEDFMYDYTHFEGVFTLPVREPSPLEEITLIETLEKLDEVSLKELYDIENTDNYVFDLANEEDCDFLVNNYDKEVVLEIGKLIVGKEARFIRMDGEKPEVVDIKKCVEDNWSEIFTKVMLFPHWYSFTYECGKHYYTSIFYENMLKMLGYTLDYQTNEVTYKK